MKRALRMALVVFVFYILQTSVFTSLRIDTIQPDIMAVMLACLTAYTGPYGTFCAGAVTGLLMDTFVGHVMALYIVLYPLMGVAAAQLRLMLDRFAARIFKKHFRSGRHYAEAGIVCAVIVLFREAIFITYMFLNGMEVSYLHVLRALTCVIYSMVLVIPGDWLVKRLLHGKPKRHTDEDETTSAQN